MSSFRGVYRSSLGEIFSVFKFCRATGADHVKQSCKTVILSFSFLTDDFLCLNKVFTLHYITLNYITDEE